MTTKASNKPVKKRERTKRGAGFFIKSLRKKKEAKTEAAAITAAPTIKQAAQKNILIPTRTPVSKINVSLKKYLPSVIFAADIKAKKAANIGGLCNFLETD